jgi:hypothetical protein
MAIAAPEPEPPRADGLYYGTLLRFIHWRLLPRTYVEIGVFRGATLALARPETRVIGVDPDPRLARPLGANATVLRETSDDFFARTDLDDLLGGDPVDLAFVDGMHLFEFALRDLMHLERLALPGSTVLVHDCYPADAESAARERTTSMWTGDVWKLVLILREYRPDLRVTTLGAAPSGLGVVQGLDPTSRVLDDAYDEIVDRYRDVSYSFLERDEGKAHHLRYASVTPARLRDLWPASALRPRPPAVRLNRLVDELPGRARWFVRRSPLGPLALRLTR